MILLLREALLGRASLERTGRHTIPIHPREVSLQKSQLRFGRHECTVAPWKTREQTKMQDRRNGPKVSVRNLGVISSPSRFPLSRISPASGFTDRPRDYQQIETPSLRLFPPNDRCGF
jgi:hypothetical protein